MLDCFHSILLDIIHCGLQELKPILLEESQFFIHSQLLGKAKFTFETNNQSSSDD